MGRKAEEVKLVTGASVSQISLVLEKVKAFTSMVVHDYMHTEGC